MPVSFGMQAVKRHYVASEGYRFGFNGKENDDEWSGSGNMLNYGFRIHDPRLGRFLSVDPLAPEYPWYTPYQYAGNKPINSVDLDGLEEFEAFISYKSGQPIIGIKMVDANAKYSVHWVNESTRLKVASRKPTTGEGLWIRPDGNTLVDDFLNGVKKGISSDGNFWGIQFANGDRSTYRKGDWITFSRRNPSNSGGTSTVNNPPVVTRANLGFNPGSGAFANPAAANSTISSVAAGAPNSRVTTNTQLPVSQQTNDLAQGYVERIRSSGQLQITTIVRSTITVSFETSLTSSAASPNLFGINLMNSRFQTIRNGLVAIGVPASRIIQGPTTFNVPNSVMGGPNRVTFVSSTSTTVATNQNNSTQRRVNPKN